MLKSNLIILMANKNIRHLNYLQENANLSWDILNKLLKNEKIQSIRLGNLFKICNVLECNIEELILIKYPYKPIDLINKSSGKNNLKLLMALNNIETINDLIRLSSISWGVIKKIQDNQIDSIELNSLIQVSFALNCKIEDIFNFNTI